MISLMGEGIRFPSFLYIKFKYQPPSPKLLIGRINYLGLRLFSKGGTGGIAIPSPKKLFIFFLAVFSFFAVDILELKYGDNKIKNFFP